MVLRYFFKRGGILFKTVSFFILIGILTLLIVVYGYGKRPQWAELNSNEMQNLFVVRVEVKLNLPDLEKVRQDSHKKAVAVYREAVFNMAIKQIKIAYNWETLDQETRSLAEQSLSNVLKQIKFEHLYELSAYTDLPKMKRYGIYAIESSELEVILQGVYESVNKVMLKLFDEEEEIEDNNNGDENEMAS